MKRILACLAFAAAAVVATPSVATAAACGELRSVAVPSGTVTLAELVAPAPSRRPAVAAAPPGAASPYAGLPEFCRVAVTLKPTPNSDIKAEVWLPSSGWNGKLQVVGNGAFAGTISYPAMATAVAAGYAAASTDTGHTGPSSNTFAHEDVVVDFAHRAVHETTVAAKAVVRGLLRRGADVLLLQRLFDRRTPGDDRRAALSGGLQRHRRRRAGDVRVEAGVRPDLDLSGDRRRRRARCRSRARRILNQSVLAACDGLDGAKDGVLENPQACRFDPQVLVCKEGTDPAACLTPPQVEAVRKIYAGASNPRTGRRSLPDSSAAASWDGPASRSATRWTTSSIACSRTRHGIRSSLNFDAHLALVDTPENLIFDATNPDLTPFTRRGGKLIMYQGWAEPGIPPGYVVNYYGEVQTKTRNARDSVRLFMVPGMGHCGGGNGASTFDMVAALDRWVTTGTAPASIPASRVREGKTDRTRPLCPYPQIARSTGAATSTTPGSVLRCASSPR